MGDGSKFNVLGIGTEVEISEQDRVNAHLTRLGLGDHVLHDDAHITSNILETLVQAYNFGNAATWMAENLNNKNIIPPDAQPEILRKAIERFTPEQRATINASSQIITDLANSGDHNNENQRRSYQAAEDRIMSLVLESIAPEVSQISRFNRVSMVAERGGLYFQHMVTGEHGIAIHSISMEAKRLLLQQRVADPGSEFPLTEMAVGLGYAKMLPSLLASYRHIASSGCIVDDVISSGVTQVAMARRMLELGMKPKQLIVATFAATTGGVRFIETQVNQMKDEFNLPELELVLGCGVVCHSVNGKMYLLTPEGSMYCGDVGDWNKKVNKPEIEA